MPEKNRYAIRMSKVQPAIDRLYQIVAHEQIYFREGDLDKATEDCRGWLLCHVTNELSDKLPWDEIRDHRAEILAQNPYIDERVKEAVESASKHWTKL